jgi:hypothetical protein
MQPGLSRDLPPLNRLVGPDPPARLLALDPGDTTGVAMFKIGRLWKSTSMARDLLAFERLIVGFAPDILVVESYNIYASKLERHTFSNVPTLRLIGAIEFIALKADIPIVWQSAATGKGFVTDEKLKWWGYYTTESRHARDAIRHGVHYLIFRS